MRHELKTWPFYFEDIRTGHKRFEMRKDDRDFQSGDTLLLREWHTGACRYTGREVTVRVIHIMRDATHVGLMPGFCAMSIELIVGSEVLP